MSFVVYRDQDNLWRWSFMVNERTIAEGASSHDHPQRCMDDISEVRSAMMAPIRFLNFFDHSPGDAPVKQDGVTSKSNATPDQPAFTSRISVESQSPSDQPVFLPPLSITQRRSSGIPYGFLPSRRESITSERE